MFAFLIYKIDINLCNLNQNVDMGKYITKLKKNFKTGLIPLGSKTCYKQQFGLSRWTVAFFLNILVKLIIER